MHECLLCKRNMKIATTVFGNGCIRSIYKFLDIKFPKNVKDKESYLYKSIMKKLKIVNLNKKQQIWLVDRYLTLQYLEKLKYGDYVELKKELNKDITNVNKTSKFSQFITANKVALKQVYDLYKKEEKFNNYINEINYVQDTAKVGLKLLWDTLPINLIIKKNTNPFEIPAIKNMQYALWQVVAIGGNVVGYDTSAQLLEHSLTDTPKDIVITDGKIVDEIKKDPQFQKKLKEIVEEYGKDSLNFNTNDVKKISIQFDNSDLYFALHQVDIKVVGVKKDKKWDLKIELTDTYDYTEFKKLVDYIKDANSVPKSIFSSFIYNLAHISVMFGVISEYRIIIKFNMDNY